ncbi:hypothetical protein F4775DRAFT_574146 [Biscogniauxia sp. FL1348]|nr:hypothetical protein F4775DRAFT_574146 [Biscogniauxia sp. FL1348]
MTYICCNVSCGHSLDSTCKRQGTKHICCKCGDFMYRSQVHTPLSSCSEGSLASCGKNQPETFEGELKKRLEFYSKNTTNLDEQDTRKLLDERISSWSQDIRDLFTKNDPIQPRDENGTVNELQTQAHESTSIQTETKANAKCHQTTSSTNGIILSQTCDNNEGDHPRSCQVNKKDDISICGVNIGYEGDELNERV